MVLIVKLIGIAFIIFGCGILVKPNIVLKCMGFFLKGKRIYLAGLVRIILGIMFLFASSSAGNSVGIIILGILFVIAGLAIFVLTAPKAKKIINWWQEKPLSVIRLIGIMPVIIGSLTLYFL